MKKSDLQYQLDEKHIATKPVIPQHNSKLLILNKKTGKIIHKHFYDLPNILKKSDVLVFNQTKVVKSNIIGEKTTGGKVDLLLVKKLSDSNSGNAIFKVLGKNIPKINQKIIFDKNLFAVVVKKQNKFSILEFNQNNQYLDDYLDQNGKMPIPPYIRKKRASEIDSKTDYNDESTYQTSYAKDSGSIAAPTAGLHFTKPLLEKLKSAGIKTAFVTLHVGMGTFEPIQTENLSKHRMHSEQFTLSHDVAQYLNAEKEGGSRIIAVGTTTVRTLETCTDKNGKLIPQSGETDIFIYPPYSYRYVDGIITNFHLPGSTLLALVMAFCDDTELKNGKIGKAYTEAIQNDYCFYSYGDGMLII